MYAEASSGSVSFEAALAHHRAGRLPQAEAIYRQILASQPDHADCLHLLGVALLQAGHPDRALDVIIRVVKLQPSNSVHHSNMAGALRALGRRDEAIASYRQALQLKPDNLDAHNQLGALLGECGDVAGAEAHYRFVLRHPAGLDRNLARAQVDARFNLANLLAKRKQFDDAVGEFRHVLRQRPDFAAAHCNLGAVLFELSAFEECERCYREALRLDPAFADVHNNLGGLLIKLGRLDEAEVNLREACKLKPAFPGALNNLGDLLRLQGRLDEAEACCREALRLEPDYFPAQLTLGNALREAGRFQDAEPCYRVALAHDPALPEALNNLGAVLFDLGRPDESIQTLRTAVSQRPDYADAHFNLAASLLLAGQFDEGWREYEWRWKQAKKKPHLRGFSQPLWGGEDIGDRVLLLHAEQGLGDTLQFVRFVPAIAAKWRVVLEVQRALLPLLAPLLAELPGLQSIVALGDPLPTFDLHCPLLSLPRALGTTLETIPREVPYLQAAPQSAAAWRQRVGQLDGLRVGLVWAGNQTMSGDQRRSVSLDRFSELADLPGVSFVSLQKGPAASQSPPTGLVLHDWTDDLHDFGETAGLIEALDLVIGVDTAVVHLAGALGRPVWLLNRFDRCWRWLLNRDDSPWYPTLRQFRQPQPGDWRSVLQDVRAELEKGSLTRSSAR
ncbi:MULTISPECIES: tetratricopeptide repeat protein [Bradyrhizobium]|uniref:tetratricopeptide repeat protein n=1 Tax=Bradyrhizobium TaxID=374 RepID=UPI000403B1C5|nr:MULTISPECIES: tetratricopeptide repeat protein [Bradyrhizobium]QOG22844.1 tetratricopeptide repeat protein [Bradyrhizobium sp. SEMIA]UFW53440.1 tetratricopeptide repeat protein [Bradyrhizobium arachidis]